MIHEKIQIQVPGSACSGWLYTYLWDNSIELEDGRLRPPGPSVSGRRL